MPDDATKCVANHSSKLLWYSMYYLGMLTVRMIHVQRSKRYSILAPQSGIKPGQQESKNYHDIVYWPPVGIRTGQQE